ncbi:MAG: hypothetical protein P8P30_03875 [Rickettsiales bacterium]|nr:hypothetical protein [Rickettsiales bacterium]
MTTDLETEKKFTSKVAKSDWAVNHVVEPSEEDTKPKTFLEKIAPKSKKGRVVFAAGTAQVVSMCLTAVAGYWFKNHKPKTVKNWEKSMVKVFNNSAKNYTGGAPEKGPNYLRARAWKGFMDYDDYQNTKRYSGIEYNKNGKLMKAEKKNNTSKHSIQAGTLTQFIAMGLTNILSTIAVRNLMDERLDINLGGDKVFKTQMIDSVAGIGAMIGIPMVFARQARDARMGIKGLINKWPVKAGNEKRRDEIGKSFAFSIVNVNLPDFVGFAAGLSATFRELDVLEKEKAAEAKLQELEAQKGRV